MKPPDKATKQVRRGLPSEVRAWLGTGAAASAAASSASAAPPLSPTTRPSTPPGEAYPAKRARATPLDVEITAVSEVCEAEGDEEHEGAQGLLASTSEGAMRMKAARLKHLETLAGHAVYEARQVPQGVRPLTCRWVDRDDGLRAKSRLTARGFEQHLSGDEQFYSHTPLAPTLRTLLVVAQSLGYSVSVCDCQDAFSQAPIQEQSDVWVWPPVEAEEPPGVGWLLRRTLPGLKGGPAAWQDHAGAVMATLGLEASRIDPCVSSCKKRNLYMMRHMDDFLMIGPKNELEGIHNEMKVQMLLRDIVFLDLPGDNVQFLGWQLARTARGFDVLVNQQLARDIVEDEQSADGASGLQRQDERRDSLHKH